MIIDAHVYSLPPRLRSLKCNFPASEVVAPAALHQSSPVEEVELALKLSAPEEITASMEAAGIDVAVLTSLPWNTPALCAETNEHVLGYACETPHFMPVCSVQPNNINWLAEAQFCIDHGALGIKINPAWQSLDLDSANISRLAGFCSEACVFLEIHIDHAFKHSPASAAALCTLLKKCPDVKILSTHLGGLLGLYSLHSPVATLLKNVWFDTAVSSTLQFVDYYVNVGLGEKLIFGSDFPFNHSHSQQQVLEGLRARGYEKSMLHGICGKNFRRLCNQRQLNDCC